VKIEIGKTYPWMDPNHRGRFYNLKVLGTCGKDIYAVRLHGLDTFDLSSMSYFNDHGFDGSYIIQGRELFLKHANAMMERCIESRLIDES